VENWGNDKGKRKGYWGMVVFTGVISDRSYQKTWSDVVRGTQVAEECGSPFHKSRE
jgi:hypothetical protein